MVAFFNGQIKLNEIWSSICVLTPNIPGILGITMGRFALLRYYIMPNCHSELKKKVL
jgi:hypothetical protein